ncbi:peptide-N(4)-(N-acetyl-beta-glucosaminyl)asparagine amidase-like [Paramacrobiotus metropolitanus]|uniref:peptide-N(4)-(N-acetyl-beta- glucosaminyl)asparagine amidase-like n=1 Tax=Paramacrobiotus metropolitanus TaxID=2943436 RepID=UPI0024462AD2|nr:peptide-N(4)-(N-acetyl-beta-glucosaminyl)asparagine amidase-like [Paramacrobiotus metropolitanus]
MNIIPCISCRNRKSCNSDSEGAYLISKDCKPLKQHPLTGICSWKQRTMSFFFPGDRFPVFDAVAIPGIPPEKFGPPLRFNPYCQDYEQYVSGIDCVGYEFVPKGEEVNQHRMEVLYNVVNDAYFRTVCQNDANLKRTSRWKSCVWRCCNVDRKVEDDWGMAYLARRDLVLRDPNRDKSQNLLQGVVEWKFNLKKAGLQVKNLQVRVPHKLYRDGVVVVTICSRDDYTVLLDAQNLKSVSRAVGWDEFIIRAELSGAQASGGYQNAYQNAQLFRQPLSTDRMFVNEDWKNPFKVVIEMEKASEQ